MAGLGALNNLVFRKSSSFGLAVIISAFFFERSFDMTSEAIFSQINKGKTWNEIKHRYAE